MANASLGTLAISMTLWFTDLGAAQIQKPATDSMAKPVAAATKTCQPGQATPADADSDLEVVVCAKPIAR